MTEGTLHKVRAVAEHFDVTNRTVLNWIRAGRLDAVHVSGHVRIPEEALQKLIQPIQGKKTK